MQVSILAQEYPGGRASLCWIVPRPKAGGFPHGAAAQPLFITVDSPESNTDPASADYAGRAKPIFEILRAEEIVRATKEGHHDLLGYPALVAAE